MANSSQFDEMLHDWAAKLDEASRIVAMASDEGRELTPSEDSHVLQLVKQAQNLDEAMARMRRHCESGSSS
jgi:hypothetical protein